MRCAPTFRPSDKAHYVQPGVGHYGVFNGSRFRAEIAPRIADFALSCDGGGKPYRAPWRPPNNSRTSAFVLNCRRFAPGCRALEPAS